MSFKQTCVAATLVFVSHGERVLSYCCLPRRKRHGSIMKCLGEAYVLQTMISKMVTCGSGARHLLQIGFRCDLDDIENNPWDGIDKAIFIIPGNPGGIIFYEYLMESMYFRTGIPVFGLSPAGLAKDCIRSKSGPLTVRRLVEDELEILDRFVPKEVSIILMGHSVGSFVAKEIMKLEPERRFLHAVLMSPTLQSLGETPGATGLTFVWPFVFYYVVFMLSMLPRVFLTSLIRMGLWLVFGDYPECTVVALTGYFNVPLLMRARQLASDEFLQIQDLDVRFISRNLHRLSLIYAERDEWVPESYIEIIRTSFPDADTVVVPSTLHLFNFSRRMTDDVLDVVCKRLEKYRAVELASKEDD